MANPAPDPTSHLPHVESPLCDRGIPRMDAVSTRPFAGTGLGLLKLNFLIRNIPQNNDATPECSEI